MRLSVLLLLTAVLPALADTRFQVRQMKPDDVPPGRGQCDIRLQVDNEVEVTLQGDQVSIHTLAGQDAKDDGSACNAPLPNRDVENFNFEVKESRNDIRIVTEPSPRNGFSATVHIRDGSSGSGRYHFRLTWVMTDAGAGRPGGPSTAPGGLERSLGGSGFSWNNTVAFKGKGRGEAWLNDFGPVALGEVSIEIDHGGKLLCWFKSGRGKGITFNGTVMAREQNRWKADVMSDDRRYRGPLWFTVDGRGAIAGLSIDAGDGRDRMQLNWDRK